MFGNDELIFSRSKLGSRLVQNGATPKGLITFGLLAYPKAEIFWRNTIVDGTSLFIFPPDGELFAITRSDFDVFAVSVSEAALENSCALLELPNFKTLVNQNEVFQCHPEALSRLRTLLFNIDNILTNRVYEFNGYRLLKQIEQEIAIALVRGLSSQHRMTRRGSQRKRDISFKVAESYIRQSEGSAPSIPELCFAANASQRMLQYAFQERYQMSPKAYLIIDRLNRVHKELKLARYGSNRVSDIARENGFWHMGKFSGDYKKLFSESPSETLKNDQFIKLDL